MALANYSDLQAKIADTIVRTDLTNQIIDAIALAEAEMQVDCKLVEFETDSSITITSGTGNLPTGFVGMRSAYWDSSTDTPLIYIDPQTFNATRNSTGGTPSYYTISGSTIRVNEAVSGTVIATCYVRFTPLSVSNTTNAILTNFPNAYLYGALKHICAVTQDDQALQKFGAWFAAEKERIQKNNEDRKYGGSLQVRAA